MFRKFLPLFLIIPFILSACSLHVTVPVITPEPVIVDAIHIPLPSGSDDTTRLELSFGAGTLILSPGSDSLVGGNATYNLSDLKPQVTVEGSTVRIEQGDYRLDGIPDLSDIENEWDLQLGNFPLDLDIEAGAYNAEYSLGGLSLVNLTIQDGASKANLSFDQPNLVEMNLFHYETGASNVTITGLANANFTHMDFFGGAGNYRLDFSGQLMRPASVTIEAGVSNLTLVIPEGLPVQLTVESALATVNHPSGWTKNGGIYTQSGDGPQLIILVEIGAGNLTITR